jgi:hypothetical protein
MGIREFTEYTDNPFNVPDIRMKRYISKGTINQLTNKSTGEVYDIASPSKEYMDLHDPGKYIKLFSDGVGIIADLGIRGVALLCYVMENLKPGVPIIELPRKLITADIRYKTLKGGGYYVGIADLLSHGVIARVQGACETYFINANILFNGDRKRMYKDKIKQDETVAK